MPSKNVGGKTLSRMLLYLNPKQQKGFRDYLACALFNTNPTLVLLYDCFQEKLLLARPEFLTEEELLAGSGINAVLLDKLCSHLMGHLRRFVSLWAQKDRSQDGIPVAFEAWMQMGLEADLIEREYRRMKRSLQKGPAGEFDSFNLLRLEHAYVQFKAQQPRKAQQELFAAPLALLEDFYLTTKLKYMCATISLGQIFRRGEGSSHISLSDDQPEALSPLGKIYLQTFKLLQKERPGDAEVMALFELMESKMATFSRHDQSDLLGYLLNVSIQGMVHEEAAFEVVADRIYDALMDKGLLIEGGKMAGYHFKNIVSIKLRVEKVAEADGFIDSHIQFLPLAERSLLETFTKGQVAFFSQDFKRAKRLFGQVHAQVSEDLILGMEARKMLWKSFFELYDELSREEYEEMVRLYSAFRNYIARNNQISDFHKEKYENFIRVFNRLIHLGDQKLWVSTVGQLREMHETVKRKEQISFKRWLLEAIERQIVKQEAKGKVNSRR